MGNLVETDKTIIVKQVPVVNAVPATCFIYCCLCFGFAGSLLGLLGDGSGLAVGILQLGVFVGYTVGAMLIMKSGAGVGGNTFFLFAAIFSGAGGMLTVGGAIFQYMGIPFSPSLASLLNIISGFILWVLVFANRVGTKTDFFIILFSAVGVTACGFGGFVAPGLLNTIAGYSLGIAGVFAFYASSIGFLEMSGVKVNYGKPLVEPKEGKD